MYIILSKEGEKGKERERDLKEKKKEMLMRSYLTFYIISDPIT